MASHFSSDMVVLQPFCDAVPGKLMQQGAILNLEAQVENSQVH